MRILQCASHEENYAVPRELRLHAWLSLVPQRLSGLRSVATWSVRVWLQALRGGAVPCPLGRVCVTAAVKSPTVTSQNSAWQITDFWLAVGSGGGGARAVYLAAALGGGGVLLGLLAIVRCVLWLLSVLETTPNIRTNELGRLHPLLVPNFCTLRASSSRNFASLGRPCATQNIGAKRCKCIASVLETSLSMRIKELSRLHPILVT